MNARLPHKLALGAAGLGIAALLAWLVMSQGPLAPTQVTVATLEQGPLVTSTFGIGTVEARRSYALGPTVASRVLRVLVDQGDAVKAGQLVAELDPVDLTDRVASGALAVDRAASMVRAAEAQLAEARSRSRTATSTAARYTELRAQGFFSQEASDAKAHEANAARANVEAAVAQLAAAGRDHERAQADAAGIGKLRTQARLVSPVDGIVSARLAEPGTTLVAGQAVVQVIDPATLWVKARIDQGQAGGVRTGLPAEIVLRSEAGRAHRGEVQRVDLVSDAVAEERIVNVGFTTRPQAISVGDLVEVTIRTAELAGVLSVPAAALKRLDRQDGVWLVKAARVTFRPVKVGMASLDGRSQILEGLDAGEEFVVHSERALKPDARVKVTRAIAGPAP